MSQDQVSAKRGTSDAAQLVRSESSSSSTLPPTTIHPQRAYHQKNDSLDNRASSSVSSSSSSSSAQPHPSKSTQPASAIQPSSASGKPSNSARIRWDGSSNASSWRQAAQLQLTKEGNPASSGPTVTARGVPAGSVQRPNRPGPLNLAERLTPASEPSVLSLTGAKGLDEQGFDNRAFLELQRELQRHESRSDEGGRLGEQRHPLQDVVSQRDRERQSRLSEHGLPPAGFSVSNSGATTPGATSDSSYDPANDSDLDHVDIIAGEVDGMPSRIKKSRQDDDGSDKDESQSHAWSKLRSMFGKRSEEDQLDENEKGVSAARDTATHSAQGPTNHKALPVETSSGLHTVDGPRRRPTKHERKAARLVKHHKLSQTKTGASALNRINRSHLPDSGESTPDALDTAMQMDARPVASGGVLGNLLKLYEQQQKALDSQVASSAASTTDYVGLEENSHTSIDDMDRMLIPEAPASSNFGDLSPPAARHNKRRDWSVKDLHAERIGKAVTSAVNEERPKAARNGAGVFGALVATTGNLVGAVSPNHAQLGPNPKRSGFRLDRYLLPEMDAKTLKRTAEIVADAAPTTRRPSGCSSYGGTRTQSAPGTPMLTHDKGHNGNAQPITPPVGFDMKKASSSILMMPTQSRASTLDPAHPKKGHHLHFPGALSKVWTHSGLNTPELLGGGGGVDYFGADADRHHKQAWQRKLKKRAKDKRRKEEIFITMHVAAILQRHEFILKLARALMMFGAPTHRIETQIQQTARVLEVNCRCIYLPNLMLLAFGDEATHTSETKFIKQTGGLDLTKLTDMHSIYWNVIHDKIGVGEASEQLDELMRRKPLIGRVPMVLIGGFASAFICPGPQGYGGSFIDSLAAFPLGMFLVYCQSIITTELYSNVFEIVFATLNSFIAAALQSSGYFCYSAVVSASIVLILPGFIVLSGALELQSKNMIAGSVRLVYALIYSLFLGFGLSIGTAIWNLVRDTDKSKYPFNQCSAEIHRSDEWWRTNVSELWSLLVVPGYSISLSLRNQAKVNRKEFPVMIAIACAGWATNHFSSKAQALDGRSDITSALGSLVVGILSNIYGCLFDGRSFVVAVPGILYQLPSGLSNGGGLLKFVNANSPDAYASGFSVALNLIEVALGLTVGLFASTVLSYTLGGKKTRNTGGLFSF